MTSSQKTEETSTHERDRGRSGYGVILPRPTGRTAGRRADIADEAKPSRSRRARPFDASKLPQGTVKRFPPPILVDQAVRWEGSGAQQKKVVTPPSADTVRAIRVLVSGALDCSPIAEISWWSRACHSRQLCNSAPPASRTPRCRRNEFFQPRHTDARSSEQAITALLAGAYLLLGECRGRRCPR